MLMRFQFVPCVCLMTASLMFAQSAPHSLADWYDDLSCSLVRITAGDDTFGTGFFVSDDGMVVTAAHVVMTARPFMAGPRLKNGSQPIRVEITPKPNLRVTTAYGVQRGVELSTTEDDEQMAASDLAVIKTTFRPLCHLPIGDSQFVRTGTHLIAIGYPAFDTLSQTAADPKRVPNPSLYEGFLSSRHVHVPREVGNIGPIPLTWTYEVFRIQMPIANGASGSPVITDDGRVVAIVTEETMPWPPELSEYGLGADQLHKDRHSVDKVTLPSGKQVDARKILGTLALLIREFGSPGAGLAVPTFYLRLPAAESH